MSDKSQKDRKKKKGEMETFSALRHSVGGITRACGREMIDRERRVGGMGRQKTERAQHGLEGRGQTSYSSCRQLTESLK